MNLENEIINRYTTSEKIKNGYYIRIRKEIKKGKTESYVIFVYYHGIKALEWNKGILSTNPAIFLPNGKNVCSKKQLVESFKEIPESVKNDMEKIEKYFEFQVGKEASKKDIDTKEGKRMKIQIKFGKKQTHTKEELRNCIKETVKALIGKYFDEDICLSRNKVLLFLKKTKISLKELYELMLPIVALTSPSSELQRCDFNITNKQKENVIIDFDEIEEVIKNRIDVYINKKENKEKDYFHTKSDTNQERQVQQDFMVLLNQKEKDDIVYKTKEGEYALLYSRNTYPFELEYMLYAGTDRKETDDEEMIRSRRNIKGRIDNIVMDNDTIHLVEIKHGTSVIGGSNGIHKHLIDLYSCLHISKDIILKELKERIETRENAITEMENKVEINNLYYDIVCVYQESPKKKSLSKEAVQKRITDIYDKCTDDKTEVKCTIKDNKRIDVDPEENNNPNKYAKPLLKKDIKQLCEMIEKQGCKVRILLADEEFKCFEEYQN